MAWLFSSGPGRLNDSRRTSVAAPTAQTSSPQRCTFTSTCRPKSANVCSRTAVMTGARNGSAEVSPLATDDQQLGVEEGDQIGDGQAQLPAGAIKHLERRPVARGGESR